MDIVSLCVALMGDDWSESLSPAELCLRNGANGVNRADLSALRRAIVNGDDPLGRAFCEIRPPQARRGLGQFYTSASIVEPMVAWAQGIDGIDLVVDPGCGSGRFALAALEGLPATRGVALDIDPIATLMARANASALGCADRIEVRNGDFRLACGQLPIHGGKALFIGNPPYVRHHEIEKSWKDWYVKRCELLGIKGSRLSGLHAHFFLATALMSRPGDVGVYITSAEWMDVNYGKAVRDLLTDELGLLTLQAIDPQSALFSDAVTTSVITGFEVGTHESRVTVGHAKDVGSLGDLRTGEVIDREKLRSLSRWGINSHAHRKAGPGFVELGEIARVHRGAVTGANKFWVLDAREAELPESVLFPTVTRARELFSSGEVLSGDSVKSLKRVVDLPKDLDTLDEYEKGQVERFLTAARDLGVPDGYIAKKRGCWWHVGLSDPAPILATYMARRPPAFVRNIAGARHLNIAHGIYPRQKMEPMALDKLASYLRNSVSLSDGRTYAGGLTKFEPGEMERLVVPDLDNLTTWRDRVADCSANMD